MLFYKQNFFIYIISLNPFNNPIFKTKKLIIRIRETVSDHTSEFDMQSLKIGVLRLSSQCSDTVSQLENLATRIF